MARDLTIKIGQEVSINGSLYPVLLDETDILEAAEQLQAEAKTLGAAPTAQDIRTYAGKLTAFIDRALGEGSVAKIAGGKKIGVVNLMQLTAMLTTDITKSYADTLAEYLPKQ